MKWGWAEAFNRWFGKAVMSAASSPNDSGDQTGAINKLTHLHWQIDQKRKQFRDLEPHGLQGGQVRADRVGRAGVPGDLTGGAA